jgi:hypothetical protein
VDEPVHPNWPCCGEIITANVAITRQPVGRLILDTGALELEDRKRRALVILIADRGQLVIDAVDLIVHPVIADIQAVCLSVGIQHSEVVVECMVLLEEKNNVVDRLQAGRNHGDGCRC